MICQNWQMEWPAPHPWSIHKSKMAMAFLGKNHHMHRDIQKRHLITTARAFAHVQAQMPAEFQSQVLDKNFIHIPRYWKNSGKDLKSLLTFERASKPPLWPW